MVFVSNRSVFNLGYWNRELLSVKIEWFHFAMNYIQGCLLFRGRDSTLLHLNLHLLQISFSSLASLIKVVSTAAQGAFWIALLMPHHTVSYQV